MSRRVNRALRKAGGQDGWLAALLMFVSTVILGVIFVGHGLAIGGFDGVVSVGLGLFCLLAAAGMVVGWVVGGEPDEEAAERPKPPEVGPEVGPGDPD